MIEVSLESDTRYESSLSSREILKKPTGSITTTTRDAPLAVHCAEPVNHVTKEVFV